jgi:hypothetical protein
MERQAKGTVAKVGLGMCVAFLAPVLKDVADKEATSATGYLGRVARVVVVSGHRGLTQRVCRCSHAKGGPRARACPFAGRLVAVPAAALLKLMDQLASPAAHRSWRQRAHS